MSVSDLPQQKAVPQLRLTLVSSAAVFKKILTVNSALVDASRKDLSLNPSAQDALALLRQMLEAGKPVTDETTTSIVVMMCTQWDYADRLAPLDLLRCMAPSPAVAKFHSPSTGGIVQVAVSSALDGVPVGSSPNENFAMMAARTIANVFRSPQGRKVIATPKSEHLDAAVSFIERVLGFHNQPPIGQFNRNLLLALTTAALNIAVLANQQGGSVPREAQVRLLDALARILGKQTDPEVLFRALVATGTLIVVVGAGEPEVRSLREVVRTAGAKVDDQRVKGVVTEILDLLR